uniref:GH14618p n=1 Tax=Drosophila melanogaster TaxID=7227 RepID=Q8MZ55_DROME|nr:GH14618p [Drosophila melanogaster]ABN49445.1 LP01542p [Drosophila melanogaster]
MPKNICRSITAGQEIAIRRLQIHIPFCCRHCCCRRLLRLRPAETAKLRTVASAASSIHGPLTLLLSWHRSGGQYRADSFLRPSTGQIIVVISVAQAPVTGQGPGEKYGLRKVPIGFCSEIISCYFCRCCCSGCCWVKAAVDLRYMKIGQGPKSVSRVVGCM